MKTPWVPLLLVLLLAHTAPIAGVVAQWGCPAARCSSPTRF